MSKGKVFTKTRGVLTGTGASAAEATADLNRKIDFACSHAGGYVETRLGMVLVVCCDPEGYAYTVIDGEEIANPKAYRINRVSDSEDAPRYSWTYTAAKDYTEVLDIVRASAAQRAWNPESPEETDAALIARSAVSKERAAFLAELFSRYRAKFHNPHVAA